MTKLLYKTTNLYRRASYALGLCMLTGLTALAQNAGAGSGALQQAGETIHSYIPAVQSLIFALAGVVALVGAISVFIKMNNEEQDVKKSIMMIVGACVFLVIAAEALPTFFD